MDFDKSLVIFISIISFLYYCAEGAKWTYGGETGVHHWHRLFPEACSGRSQSPINIERHQTVYDRNLRDFAIWFDPPKPGTKMTLKNTGYAIKVNIYGDFYITNGGLTNQYKTAQFHFHWGEGNFHGSEHLIDGKQYPIELHAVHYDSDKYDDLMEAVTQPRGLAVLGVLYEISEEDNPVLETVIKHLHKVRDPEAYEVEIDPISIRYFLPRDIRKYYRYDGSLTTPGCFESVIWTVFEEKQTISLRQLNEFRKVLKAKHKKHGKKRNRNKRAKKHKGKKEAAAETVLEELGIEDDAQAQEKLEMEVEFSSIKEGGIDNKDKEMEKSEDDIVRIGGKGESMKDLTVNAKDDLKEVEMKDDGAPEDDDNDDQEENHQYPIVNNYRPVQPLHNREVFRSFRAIPKHQERMGRKQTTRYTEPEVMKSRSENDYSSATTMTSGALMVITIMSYFILKMFS